MAYVPGTDFTKIVNSDLEPVAVVAQCLDNQWVPQELLASMLKKGKSLRDPGVTGQRQLAVRHEYLRALLNAQQVIVNRAFFLNNQAVYQDFRDGGASREAFKSLLADSVIIPYLYREDTLVQDEDFTVQPEGVRAWRDVVGDTRGSCLRLSWDNTENGDLTRVKLQRPFRRQLLVLPDFDPESLQRDFALDEEGARLLKARLIEVSRWAAEQELVSREDFYRKFVVADGSDPADGRYDRTKPFAAELKQLADLKYGTALPDAMSRYPLTPTDSLDRTALQEVDRAIARGGGASVDGFVDMLRQQAFALVQRPLDVGLTGLELEHVRRARGTDEWTRYKNSLLDLLREPQEMLKTPERFTVQGQAVYDRYVAVAERLAAFVGTRRADEADRWQPVIKVSIHTLGSVISLIFHDEPQIEVVGQVADSVAAEASRAVVRFSVVGRDQRRAERELQTSVDLMQVKLQRTRDDWADLVRRLQEAGFVRREADAEEEQIATLNAPETDEQ
ncbi:hypothetical protein [Streptomyces griseoflavus]|uniref:hypothetical protein n=1 Tax=Streptomyces griseoflavus TaxID=35619 RepID=UPI0033FFC73F